MSYETEQHRRLLAFDTSTATLAVALVQGGEVKQCTHDNAERNHSIKLVPAMHDMLQTEQWGEAQLDGIAVGMGPGSYTGVRIAVTAAKTIAWAWNKPVIGVSSLRALALTGTALYAASAKDRCVDADYSDKQGNFTVYPLMNARRGQVYTASFTGFHAELNTLLDHASQACSREQACKVEQEDSIRMFVDVAREVEQLLLAESNQNVLFVGETIQQQDILDELSIKFGARIQVIPCEMDAGWIGVLGQAALTRGEQSDVHRLEPNYTQVTEAEAKLNAHNAQQANN
ncbi:tRNA (adenosine(37)-N6)-threonylcarbamoyltransferase complex dimerization subunit type 1 TsaB [Paenibacillus sp. UMB4589-SE434]|uniref:tRNA (adenosine(37)-N6)-threonylcarbamoyltransferase complex dimerization subunit type 1 TsaB n=1 Tax=Paenibacillus sp. UMB4589-SE434 TaxID=3046314 RepID=UPI00254DB7CF|nr:tRNA (adenosine(37)-N6)-threonylcarbamoyltransferase complex dimerization subunit type 1 TsaB [Paenibacillus sp. UMB4589-SE434]MDK8182055.1 tRNA (adenosine(37)-N6)-threonylcarbamoyltransferase complex dimerization subunit type 1 TsaB [Paenibacillus sp. UMB4589-SE434]